MAYRNDLDALKARHAALSAEVEERTRERDEAARMLDEACAREEARAIAADRAAGGPARRRGQLVMLAAGVATAIALIAGIAYTAQRASREHRLEAIYAQYVDFTDRLCACKTIACSDAVMQRISEWGKAIDESDIDSGQPDPGDVERFTELGKRIGDCWDRIRADESIDERLMNGN